MHRTVCDSEQSARRGADEPSLVRRLLSWAQRADVGGRAEAASALARAYLYSDLDARLRREAEIGLTSLLDDNSALVRRALAEALAGAHDAPHHIILALASDQSDVASAVLARSPVLTDAELVDCAAIGDARAQIALARRPGLSVSVAAALAEIGCRDAVIALIDNLDAALSPSVMRRIAARFGADAEAREALLARPGLPALLRCDLAAATAEALCDFVVGRQWLSAERALRVAREAREQAALSISMACNISELAGLVRHLREGGALTIALLLRALLSGDRALFAAAMAELSRLPPSRILAFIAEPRGGGFAALYGKTGLPAHFLPVFRAALLAIADSRAQPGEELSWALVDRVVAACDRINSPELDKLKSLLRRFETEAARLHARLFAAQTAPAHQVAPLLLRLEAGSFDESASGAPLLIAVQAHAGESAAPPVELPLDRIVALPEAA